MTENNSFQKVQTTLSAEASEQIYLSEKDITKIAKVMTNNREESEIRDMFVVACYTALRFSDIQLLNKATIQNGSITLYQEKTKELVEIPILKEIVSLINHYQQYGFPSFTSCKANQVIRELAKRSGINELITYKECRGGISYIIQKPKWERISFHTARRSCITNLYKRGYPINYIMSLSGHRSMQAFQRYMRASSKEIASNFMDYLKKEDAVL